MYISVQDSLPAFRHLLAAAIILLPPTVAPAQAIACTPLHEERTFQFRGQPVRLDILRPQRAGKYPIVLMLHGAAGLYSPELTAGDKDNFGEHQLACSGRVAILVHYLDVSNVRFASSALIQRDALLWVEVVKAAVGAAAGLPYAAPKHLYILGESLGGYLALAVGLEDRRIKKVFVLSGGFAEAYTRKITNKPKVFMYHGAADAVVPLQSAEKSCSTLKAAGVHCNLAVLPQIGHVFPPDSTGAVVKEVVRLTR